MTSQTLSHERNIPNGFQVLNVKRNLFTLFAISLPLEFANQMKTTSMKKGL